MQDEKMNQKILNKYLSLESKFQEIEPVVKVLNLWIKENDFEIYPIMKILNEKMSTVENILKKP